MRILNWYFLFVSVPNSKRMLHASMSLYVLITMNGYCLNCCMMLISGTKYSSAKAESSSESSEPKIFLLIHLNKRSKLKRVLFWKVTGCNITSLFATPVKSTQNNSFISDGLMPIDSLNNKSCSFFYRRDILQSRPRDHRRNVRR